MKIKNRHNKTMANLFKLHYAAYYGNFELLLENYNEELWKFNYTTLNYCLETGCCINPLMAYNIINEKEFIITRRVLISIFNLMKRFNIEIKGLEKYNINKKDIKDNLLKIIEYGKMNLIKDYITYEFEEDPYETLRSKMLNITNMENFSSFYGSDITLTCKFNKIDDFYIMSGMTNQYNSEMENFKRAILINVEFAKRCYDKDIIDKYILTSLISNNPEEYIKDFQKYKLPITYMYYFPKNEDWINEYMKIDEKIIYPLLNNLLRIKKKNIYINFIKYPEYNIYITAKQLKLSRVLERFKDEKQLIKIFNGKEGDYLKEKIIINKKDVIIPKFEEDEFIMKYDMEGSLKIKCQIIDDNVCISSKELMEKIDIINIEKRLQKLDIN